MNFCAIICEYNPFTNGHEYLIKKAIEETGLPVLCIMSGNFVQRGEPSVLSKFDRAQYAILAGASIVIELPTIYATAPAEVFARGAINILSKIRNIKYLYFGAETNDTEKLIKLASLIALEDETFKIKLKEKLKIMTNYRKAYNNTIAELYGDEASNLLSGSNNILGIEYLKALQYYSSKIVPKAIMRQGESYNSDYCDLKYSSASYLRNCNNLSIIKQNTPLFTHKTINFAENVNGDKLETIIKKSFIDLSPMQLKNIFDMSCGIENKILNEINKGSSLEELIINTENQQFSKARIKRILLHTAFGITNEMVINSFNEDLYIKVLACDKHNKNILSSIDSKLQIITTKKDYDKLNEFSKEVINIDINSSDKYSLITNTPLSIDYKTGVIFI
ncbi:MAG: nucleotidyltransferase family protein [Clostridia bacterium]